MWVGREMFCDHAMMMYAGRRLEREGEDGAAEERNHRRGGVRVRRARRVRLRRRGGSRSAAAARGARTGARARGRGGLRALPRAGRLKGDALLCGSREQGCI